MKTEIRDLVKAAVREAIAEGSITLGFDGWLTIEEAAAYIRHSPAALEKLVSRRSVPFHRRGRGAKVLFRRSELDAWLMGFSEKEVSRLNAVVERFRG